MNIVGDDLVRILDEIYHSLVAEEDSSDTPSRNGSETGEKRTLTAIVDITGAWSGSVVVRCETTTAEFIAGAMFAIPTDELARADVLDALGEFTNMAAGMIKGAMGGERYLGLPSVAEGGDYMVVIPHTRELLVVDYPVSGGVLSLAVNEDTRGT